MLFRKPVKDDIVRDLKNMTTWHVLNEWDEETFNRCKEFYEFVTITPVEPPPSLYVNVYKNGNVGITHKTRHEADADAGLDRIACVNLNLLEGRYDE